MRAASSRSRDDASPSINIATFTQPMRSRSPDAASKMYNGSRVLSVWSYCQLTTRAASVVSPDAARKSRAASVSANAGVMFGFNRPIALKLRL